LYKQPAIFTTRSRDLYVGTVLWPWQDVRVGEMTTSSHVLPAVVFFLS